MACGPAFGRQAVICPAGLVGLQDSANFAHGCLWPIRGLQLANMGEGRPDVGDPGSDRSKVCCVLLAAPGGPDPGPLLCGLRDRGVQVRLAANAPNALVELATHPGGILIVFQPQEVNRSGELVAAVRRYFPSVQCRQYFQDGQESDPRLVAFPDEGQSQSSQAARETGADLTAPGQTDCASLEPGATSVVTEEELAMLIGLGSVAKKEQRENDR